MTATTQRNPDTPAKPVPNPAPKPPNPKSDCNRCTLSQTTKMERIVRLRNPNPTQESTEHVREPVARQNVMHTTQFPPRRHQE